MLQNHVSAVSSLSFSPDHAVLLSGGRDRIVSAWDVETNKLLKTIALYEVTIFRSEDLRLTPVSWLSWFFVDLDIGVCGCCTGGRRRRKEEEIRKVSA